MPMYITACSVCANFLAARSCTAYDVIPDKFWNGSTVHLAVEPGQQGADVLTALDQESVDFLVQVRLVPMGTQVSIREAP